MPVSSKDRLTVVKTSAAAILIAAASVSAWAQTASQDENGQPVAQPPVAQAPALAPPELRGSTSPDLLSGEQQQTPSDTNPITSTPESYGLPAPLSDTSNTINYGRAKPKKSKLYQLPKLKKYGSPTLPPLTTYTTAPAAKRRNANVSGEVESVDLGPTFMTIPTLTHAPHAKPEATTTAFDPLGVDVGSLRLFPYVETDMGYDSNPNLLATDVVGSPFVHGEAGLKVQSQWSQNSLTANLRGGYYDYFRVPAADYPDIAGTIDGRVDVTRDTQINLESTFGVTTEAPGSPLLAIPNSVFITNRPLFATLGQTVGIKQQFNRLSISLIGAFARYIYGNATQSDGTELQLSLDNYNDYGITLRAEYELTPGFIPFMEVTGDERVHDSLVDVYGFDRNSDGILGKIGSTFEFSRLLTGELGVGYGDRHYQDPRLDNLKAPTIDAKLIYTATPLTTVSFAAATIFAETTQVYSPGVVSHILTLEVTHALMRNVTLTATGTFQFDNYEEQPISDQLYSAKLKADYHLTRTMVITGSFTRARFQSSEPGVDYTSNIVMLGLKLQL